ncbi:glycoside hydrolase/deacetylase [Rhodocollybia butyracea]|uniref:chitin deacetylase n=1 Tax=Rhodocollybia butyracea TaxID=206335 RepID=A0A9P5Q029_9AGAR|nr:glycoside hydrolase/deacetylase [Rhodocollybia butyracea]
MFLSFLPAAFILCSVFARPAVSKSIAQDLHERHEDTNNQRLPASEWYHPRDHFARQLFRRDTTTDAATYPEVAWSAAYPQSTPDTSQLPAKWTAALQSAMAAGKIPNIPQSTSPSPNTNPVYPDGYDPTTLPVCSGTYKCKIATDTWDAPDNCLGVGFDDGPTPASPPLLDFLQSNNQTATHFMIGTNIIANHESFTRSVLLGNDIAVHTWTHPYMTTLSNEDVLAQLGWTMQVIHDSTGGRVPRFWRPPYGDTDARVSAIAREVFGMDAIIWNQDTEDWSLTTGGTTLEAISSSMNTWLTGPKSPGLIILEHELSDQSVQAFKSAYPVMKSNNWKLVSVAQLVGEHGPYQNALSINKGNVATADIIDSKLMSMNTSASTSMSTSTTTSSSSPNSTSSSASDNTAPKNSASLSWDGMTVRTFAVYCAVVCACFI